MHFIRSFGLIGAGAFAAGIFYSKSSYDHGLDHWLVFAVSLAIAFAGLFDLIVRARNIAARRCGCDIRVEAKGRAADSAGAL